MMDRKKSVEIISQVTEFQEYRTLQTITFKHASLNEANQDMLPETTREVMRGNAVAQILLYHPEKDYILLSQQFRIGAYLGGEENPFIFECAAGVVDDGEDPKQAAIREAFEETGVTVKDIEDLGIFYSSAGCMDEKYYMYCGRIEENAEQDMHGLISEGEEIKTHFLPCDTVLEMLNNNEIRNGMSALSLFWFFNNKKRLQEKWA